MSDATEAELTATLAEMAADFRRGAEMAGFSRAEAESWTRDAIESIAASAEAAAAEETPGSDAFRSEAQAATRRAVEAAMARAFRPSLVERVVGWCRKAAGL